MFIGTGQKLFHLNRIVPPLFAVAEVGPLSSHIMIKPTRTNNHQSNENTVNIKENVASHKLSSINTDNTPVHKSNNSNLRTIDNDTLSSLQNTWNHATNHAVRNEQIKDTDITFDMNNKQKTTQSEPTHDEAMFAMAMASYNKA
jgi:hypothetical protein